LNNHVKWQIKLVYSLYKTQKQTQKMKNFTFQKWTMLCLLSTALLLQTNKGLSQCTLGSAYGTATVPHTGATISPTATCHYYNEYCTFTLTAPVAGDVYVFGSSLATDFITLFDATGAVLAFGNQPLSFTQPGTPITVIRSQAGIVGCGSSGTTCHTPNCGLALPFSYTSSTTAQPTGTTTAQGTPNVQAVRIDIAAVGNSGTPLSLSNLDFTTGLTTSGADLVNAKVYSTGTSTTFSTTTQFGSTVAAPGATFSVTGSQNLVAGTNYFWLVYDVSCSATIANVIDAACSSITINGNPYSPTVTNPAGTVAISALYAPSYATVGSASYSLGSIDAQIVRTTINGSAACPGTVSAVKFNTSTSTAPATDIAKAKCYYTNSATFSNAVPFGAAIVNPSAGDITFTGSQILNAGANYFWLVYDVSCSAPITDVLNGTGVSITVDGTPLTETGVVPTAKTITAIPAGTASTVANGDWFAPGTWACGVAPLTNTTAVTINHDVTVSTAGNVAGNITVAAGKTLILDPGGDLTMGSSSAGALAGNSNKLLSVSGKLAMQGGTLNVNGGINFLSGSFFGISSGTLNIDGNDGTAAGSYTTNPLLFIQTGNITATGGAINILDPHYSITSSTRRSISYSVTATDAFFGTACVFTLGGGDDVLATQLNGFEVDCNVGTGSLEIGTLNVAGGDYAAHRHMSTSSASGNFTKVRNLTINASCELAQQSSLLAITGNLVNNGIMTFSSTTVDRGLCFVGDAQYTSTIILSAATTAQSLTGNGTFRKSTADVLPTGQLGNIISQLTVFHAKTSPGFTLGMPLTVTGNLSLKNGKINTTATNVLALGHGTSLPSNSAVLTATVGTIYGSSTTAPTSIATYLPGGWVAGPFKRWVTATTTTGQQGIMPVGSDTSRVAQVLFTAAPNTGGYLTANWIDGFGATSAVSPTLTEAAVTPSTISIVANDMWQIDADPSLATFPYDATFTNTQQANVTDYINTTMLKRVNSSSPWAILGTHVATTGSNTVPTMKRTGLTGFSQFALGGGTGTLPIKVEYIKGTRQSNGNNLVWKVNCIRTPRATMILERSADGQTFASIHSITADAIRCQQSFNHVDATPVAGLNYYRLKMVDADGSVTYSTMIALLNKVSGIEMVNLLPTLVKDNAILNIASAEISKMQIVVSDANGKQLMSRNVNLIAGSNQLDFNLSILPSGTYQMTGYTTDGKSKTIRFVKQ
jgi:hypothetical protein